MRINDLENKKIVLWGTGKEGLAAAHLIGARFPGQDFSFVDEGQGPESIAVGEKNVAVARAPEALAKALSAADVIIKSPGVSLYHPLLEKEKARGVSVTSLLNLWLADRKKGQVIGVTGTKGKSTTSTLLNHVLVESGKKSVVLGNIGTPVSEGPDENADYFVIEISSYQAANFSETCDIGVLTSLYPEHLNWHTSLETYYRDKANLLAHSRKKIVEAAALATLEKQGLRFDGVVPFNIAAGFHFDGDQVYNGDKRIGTLENAFLLRTHNRGNVCAVLTAIDALGLDTQAALQVMKDYRGLPHRQYELGEKDEILFVDDSISTTPQSAIAAIEAYKERPVTLIAGGFDRGIDYLPLIDYLLKNRITGIVCLGDSGRRIFEELKKRGAENIFLASSMREAVDAAKKVTKKTGVILLSPGAPSFGMFRDYVDRAACFSKECGF
jgi:UDP-N-acetylmuramoylalanine--D-glutamate ligase